MRVSGRLMPFSVPSFSPSGRAWVISTETESEFTERMTPADLPIIEPDGIARLRVIKNLRERNTDLRRRDDLASLAADGWPAGHA
jgi:hypothetical protein